jgi:hypothetical protein
VMISLFRNVPPYSKCLFHVRNSDIFARINL